MKITQKHRLGNSYVTHNPDELQQDLWAENSGKEEEFHDEEAESELSKQMMDKIGVKFAEERMKLEA
jgi:hypothetical protein